MTNHIQPKIGTAWSGKHIILLRCNLYTGQVVSMNKSLHAPIEPLHQNCAESLSRFMSIGYRLIGTTMIHSSEIEYVLMKGL